MNKTHFSDNFLWNCFFEVHDCSTNNHCRETFKSFLSKDLCIQRREFTKLLLQSDGFRLFGRETVKSGGKERENKRHRWSSVAQPPLTLLMESEQVNAHCLLPNVTWGLSGPHAGAEQEVWFCFSASQSWEAGGCLSGRALNHHCSYHQCFHRRDLGFFQPGVKMKCMVPVLQLEKRPSAVKQKA